MKLLIWTTLITFLLSTVSLQAKDIPQELQKFGFTKHTLVDYDKKDDKEYFTFSDWTTKVFGDIVTFVVKDDEIIESIRGVGENQGEEI